MKKLTMAMAAAAVAACAEARLARDSAETEFRAVADAVLACTNAHQAAVLALGENLWAAGNSDRLDAFRAEYDARLAAKVAGSAHVPCWPLRAWPKVAEAGCAANRVAERNPYILGKARELGVPALIPWYVASAGGTEVAANVLSEMVAKRDDYFTAYDIAQLAQVKRCIQKDAEKSVKKWLRRQGKSFVTKDGVNPCAKKMEALNAALNAPRLAGLNEWFADMGLECRVDVSTLPTDAEASALKAAVLDGDKDLTGAVKRDLYLCLGVDGYNAFVKEYNGDK